MTTIYRPAPEGRDQAEARQRLEEAIAEHARRTDRYRAAIGTSAELSAYLAVRAAAGQLVARNRWLTFAEWDGPAAEAAQPHRGMLAAPEPRGPRPSPREARRRPPRPSRLSRRRSAPV